MKNPIVGDIGRIETSARQQMESFGKAWVPTIPRMFGVPPILKYECFSSWIARALAACKLSEREFFTALKIPINLTSDSIDNGACPLDIMRIAQITMTAPTLLTHLNWPLDSILTNPEFQCLTTEIENNTPIYRYCPACLSSDRTPYFRQSWRLASTYICPVHQLILRETCHTCDSRVDLRRCSYKAREHSAQNHIVLYCSECQSSLGDGPSEVIDRKFLADIFFRQEEIENLIRSTSSYWMPSDLASNHDRLTELDPKDLVWSVVNVIIAIKILASNLGNPSLRQEMREASVSKIESYLHKKEVGTYSDMDYVKGPYLGLSAEKIFCFLAPYIGLQVSKYQSITSGTIWFSDTPMEIARSLDPRRRFKPKWDRPELPVWGA